MILIRYILICIIGYLIVRSFIMFGKENSHSTDKHKEEDKNKIPQKKISKKIGEYVDYEEMKK